MVQQCLNSKQFFGFPANSEDRGVLELNQQVANVTFPEATPLVPYPEAEHIGIGRDFYALSQNLPDGTAL